VKGGLGRIHIALLVTSLAGPAAYAQSDAIALTGRVLDAGGRPLALASVSVAAFDDLRSSADTTDASGRYRVVVPRRASAFSVAVRKDGYATQTRQIAGSSTDSVIAVADFRMVRSAQSLAAVRVVASRPPPVRESERIFAKPGESELTLDPSSGFAGAITGDVSGDLQLALGGIPGIAVTPGAGGSASYTIAGLDGGQNRVTLNGADAAPAAPRDGGLLRVTTAGYDPTEAMSGIRAEWTILGATYVPNRKLRLTFDAPALQANHLAAALGPRTAAPILSGVLGGPGKGFVRFHNTSFQLSRRASSVATLASIDDASLGALGVSPDSVRRIVGALDGLGIGPLARVRGASDRTTTSASLYSRLDLTANSIGTIYRGPDERIGGRSNGADQGHVFYLLVGGEAAESNGMGAGALTLPAYASAANSHSVIAQAFNSVYPRDYILNETRLTMTFGGSRFALVSPLPAASVLTTAGGADGTTTMLQAAGNGGAASTTRSWSVQARNDTHWSSPGGRHVWKLALESLVDGYSAQRDVGRGRFDFLSVQDFVANRPSAFTRSIAGASSDVRGMHVAAAFGDSYTPSRALAWQYGVRVEGHEVQADAARNSTVDSLFGVHTGALPMRFSVAPMGGFTWRYRRNPSGFPSTSHLILGGIRDYRGTVATREALGVFGETGIASGIRELRCIDAAAPRPEWDRYGDVAGIPTECAIGAGEPALAQSALPVSLYSPSFALGHSVRADLQWSAPLSRTVQLSVRGMTAINARQPSIADLNFDGVPRFTLADEGNRPVFTPPASIGAVSGLTSTVASRRHSQFTHVDEWRSDLRSRSSSLTGELRVYPVMSRFGSGIKVPLWLAYTFTDTRRQFTGFTGTTAGDPLVTAWEPASASRHALLFGATLHVPDWFRITPGLTLRSGLRYTPLVRGDVNADGLSSNDRAFVFDPRATSDAELRDGMSALLHGESTRAAHCLGAQLGRIAAPNTCTGPWTATLNATVTVDPARLRLQNRGVVQLRVLNVLAGFDQLVHGSDRLHGWGQPAYPDPVLLQVRGFDPVARRYRYTVNRSFGDSRMYRNLSQAPFRLAIDVSLDVGPDQERVARERVLSCGTTTPRGPCQETAAPDSATLAERIRSAHAHFKLFDFAIQDAGKLGLDQAQIDTLDALGRAHRAFRDSTYDALAALVASHGARLDDAEVARGWRESLRAVARFEWRVGALARTLLTPAQADAILSRQTGYLTVRPIVRDERELERTLRLWQSWVP
jgi:hypothetical protein